MPKGKGYGEGKKQAPTVDRNHFNSSGGKKPAPGEKDRYGGSADSRAATPSRK